MPRQYRNFAIAAAVSAVAIGFLMKRARTQVAAGTPAADTIAGKIGLI